MTAMERNRAWELMRQRNRAYELAGNRRDLAVLVDGPEEGQGTVMSLSEAIDNGFCYEWAI